MRDSAQLVVASCLFLLGVAFGGIVFHPYTTPNIAIPFGIVIAIAIVLVFIGVCNLVVEGLKK